MAERAQLNRRRFLQNAGVTAWFGVGGVSRLAGQSRASSVASSSERYDFDQIYDRFGTLSTKFDMPNVMFGPGSVDIGMGVADMDFRAAPAVTIQIVHTRHLVGSPARAR